MGGRQESNTIGDYPPIVPRSRLDLSSIPLQPGSRICDQPATRQPIHINDGAPATVSLTRLHGRACSYLAVKHMASRSGAGANDQLFQHRTEASRSMEVGFRSFELCDIEVKLGSCHRATIVGVEGSINSRSPLSLRMQRTVHLVKGDLH